jgi:hypothetical protein
VHGNVGIWAAGGDVDQGEFTMNVKKIAAGAAMAGALGFSAVGFGGVAQAKPHDPGPCVPWVDCWVPGVDPPGHNPFGPPGQVMQGNPWVPGLTGVPPGHWGDPTLVGLPPTWLPRNWIELGIPGPLDVVWNPDLAAWGVWWAEQFIPYVA